MRNDLYVRVVLTVIAGALVYLCVVLTPIPSLSAQGRVIGGRTPGEYTGPAEVVIVGWRTSAEEAAPVRIVSGEVNVANTVRVSGRVEAVQPPEAATRAVIVGYEDGAGERPDGILRGRFHAIGDTRGGLPVSPLLPR